MNIKALITTLAIVGSSTAAMARPATVSGSVEGSVSIGYSYNSRGYREPAPAPVMVRDHRYTRRPAPRPVIQPIYVTNDRDWNTDSSWDRNQDWNHTMGPRGAVLATELNYGTTEWRKDIVPGSMSQRFQMLQLEGNRGSTYLMKVVVEFTDGTPAQQIDLGTTLRAGQSLQLDLTGTQGKQLKRVLVYRADGGINQVSNGEFSVLAF